MYECITLAKGLSSENMCRFSNIESVIEKIVSVGKEMNENMNDTEIEYSLVKYSLNIHRSASNEATLVSEIPNIINEKNVILAPGQEKIPV